MSTKKPPGKVGFDQLTRSSSGTKYRSNEIADWHEKHPRKVNEFRSNSNGKAMSQFGSSKSASRDPDHPDESNAALWWTPEEKNLTTLRNKFAKKREQIEENILEKIKLQVNMELVSNQMKVAKIEDPKFEEEKQVYLNLLEREIRANSGEVDILDEKISKIETQMRNIANKDNIIIEERHKNHVDDKKWIESVIKILPHLGEKYINKRYNELTSGGKKKSKKRMVQRKSKTRKVIKTKVKKTNKKV